MTRIKEKKIPRLLPIAALAAYRKSRNAWNRFLVSLGRAIVRLEEGERLTHGAWLEYERAAQELRVADPLGYNREKVRHARDYWRHRRECLRGTKRLRRSE